MENSTIQILEHDKVLIKKLYEYPVISAQELKLLLDSMPDYSPEKIGLSLIAIQALRPVEVPRITWNSLSFNEDQTRITTIRHLVYKPSNRKTKVGKNYYFKEIRKSLYSPWLSNQIINYAKKAPKYSANHLFPWTTGDSLAKIFTTIRKKVSAGMLSQEYKCFLDTTIKTLVGATTTRYRISPYSLRRFAFTFHYYLTFNQDAIALSRAFGHSRPDTTLKHYAQPKEAIGLTQEMIDKKINIDEFIHLEGKKQRKIIEFTPEWKKRFTPAGQTSLTDF